MLRREDKKRELDEGGPEGTDVRIPSCDRLVARDFKTKGKESMFAAMPPLEAKELLFRMCAKEPLVHREGKWQRRKLMFIDVKNAHLNGKVQEGEYAFVRLVDRKIWQLKFERFVRFCVPTKHTCTPLL